MWAKIRLVVDRVLRINVQKKSKPRPHALNTVSQQNHQMYMYDEA